MRRAYILRLLVIVVVLVFSACRSKDKKTSVLVTTDTTSQAQKDSMKVQVADTVALSDNDSALLRLSMNILKVIKEKDYVHLSGFLHASYGIRFSPYGYIDTTENKVIATDDLRRLGNSKEAIKWGTMDGEGSPIVLPISQYFDKYVYPKDFLVAPKKAVNHFQVTGNSQNNLKDIYPGNSFTEFYFPGFEARYQGMDFQVLRLVFFVENNQHYLVAIVHDQWTI